MNSNKQRQSYPSDISDAQWRAIAALIPPDRDRGRHRSTDIRDIVNSINYRWSTGCVWRMLPHDFPPWGTVYTYFRRWQRDGTLKELRDALLSIRRVSSRRSGPQPVSDQYPVPAA